MDACACECLFLIIAPLCCVCSLRMGGADPVPPGPEGRGPFDEKDSFVLPDGRVYVPGDGCTDALYGIT